MTYFDVRLPVNISLGTRSGLGFQTDVVVYGNGKEYRNSRWQYQRTTFDVSYVVKNRADAIEIYEFFLAAKGKFHSFRVRDELDYTSSSDGVSAPTGTDVQIGVGNGSTAQYQLIKTYSNTVGTYDRRITKPIAGTVGVNIDGAPVSFTVDPLTGIITLNSAPTVGQVITAGYEFDTHSRFNQDSLDGIEYIFLRQDSSKDRFSFPSLEIIEVID